ncbi:MAG: anaerobic ribonucleoside-triphosphate reductase [Candidatus Nanoarchaeia archaeon]|nr:anaerobic ribonucleoside-triphosphate reductase [Candidatus Nanoarchaeia archaeon]MDD5587640.1 anaerobic ribonucleoside-triphosphate reductase [Candidatus Nanoarchaeia archaeon]
MVDHLIKRDRRIYDYKPLKIEEAIRKAVKAITLKDKLAQAEKIIKEIYEATTQRIEAKYDGKIIPKQTDIEELVINTAKEIGYDNVSDAYKKYRNERTEARETLALITQQGTNTTDTALLIESDSKEEIGTWNRERIVEQLLIETDLSRELAVKIAKKTENAVINLYKAGIRRFRTKTIRGIVDMCLFEEGLEDQELKQEFIGMPSRDLERLIFSKSMENSNVSSNNPEAVNLGIAENSLKIWGLRNVYTKEIADAHRKGTIHIHDLGYIDRAYCSAHSVEYEKKYGLGKVLANLESKSNPPNSAVILNQHIQTFLASMQAHYAGALGFGFLNILYASLLNRPVEIIYGKLNGQDWSLEKRDLEKLVAQGEITLDPKDKKKKYFEKTSEKRELRDLSEKEYEQIAQNLIFASSQNAFSRGGQTLFIDFNIHTEVPKYMKRVPAIGPGGKYMVRLPDGTIESVKDIPRFENKEDLNDQRIGDADDSKLEGKLKEGHILTYGDFEETAQKFAKSMIKIWEKGDKDGRPFHFPKCDLHVNDNSFNDPKQLEIINYATEVAAKNGSIYFMFDRGQEAVLAQCCRLKEKITDHSMLKYPEKLRFCGFQNITVNLAQAAYKGKTLEGTLKEIDDAMDLALKAHHQKAEFMQKLLDTDGSPMRNLGKPSDDGSPYIDLKKSTYIIGNIGLNETVQTITGKQLHESEEAYNMGLQIIAHMYKNIQEFKEKTGLKFTLEETPAESATRRLAKIDLKYFYEEAKKVVKGTEQDPYYTNSIHFAPEAEMGITDRIVGQSKFHDMIESGAIIHAYIGEQRPDKEVIKQIVRDTLEKTRCSQLVFSPTYTECDVCGTVMPGKKELCITDSCSNHHTETLNKDTLAEVTRVVGYYSRVPKWNGSQQLIQKARRDAQEFYAGKQGIDMSWLYNPNGHEKLTIYQFGKEGCHTCKNLEDNVHKVLTDLQLDENVDYKVLHLNKLNPEDIALAAKYEIPLDTVPSLVVAGKDNYWKKTVTYGTKGERSDLIKPAEVKAAVQEKIVAYV